MSRTQRPAGTPPAQRSAVGGVRGRTEILPEAGPHAVTGGSHALDLSASRGAGLLDVLLELAGAELPLHQVRADANLFIPELAVRGQSLSSGPLPGTNQFYIV